MYQKLHHCACFSDPSSLINLNSGATLKTCTCCLCKIDAESMLNAQYSSELASYFYKHFYTPTCTWTLRTKISSFSYKVQLRFVSKFCSLIIKIFSMNVQCKVAIHTFYLLTKEGCIKSYQFLERCIH